MWASRSVRRPGRGGTRRMTGPAASPARSPAQPRAGGQRVRPAHMAADHSAQALEPMAAHQEPQLESPEAPAERDRPFTIVDDAFAAMGLREIPAEWPACGPKCPVAHEMRRAVELCTEPFVRVEDQAVGQLGPGPQRYGIPGKSCCARPGGVDMDIEAVTLGNHGDARRGHRSQPDAGAADAGDDAGRQQARRRSALMLGLQCIDVHGVDRSRARNLRDCPGRCQRSRRPCRSRNGI